MVSLLFFSLFLLARLSHRGCSPVSYSDFLFLCYKRLSPHWKRVEAPYAQLQRRLSSVCGVNVNAGVESSSHGVHVSGCGCFPDAPFAPRRCSRHADALGIRHSPSSSRLSHLKAAQCGDVTNFRL